MENLTIAGSGPAGLSAAIYAARSGLEPLVIEGFQPGGQLTQTDAVENFPGFPDGVAGPELMARMRAQAEKFGARFVMDEAAGFAAADSFHTLNCIAGGAVETRALVIATGATARKLGLPAEAKLYGRGVSGCAVCDGAFFKGQPVAVVGGGDTAVGDALYLSRMCSHVTLIHRRDSLRASKIMVERALANPKITVVWDSVVEDVFDVEKRAVTGLRVRNVKGGAESYIAASGLFVAIGHSPATAWLGGAVELDSEGYIAADMARTSVPGVFAAGDVASRLYKQAVIAASAGCVAALAAEEYLK